MSKIHLLEKSGNSFFHRLQILLDSSLRKGKILPPDTTILNRKKIFFFLDPVVINLSFSPNLKNNLLKTCYSLD